MYKISGTYCASLTPFNADYSINKKLLLEHCNSLLTKNIDGIAIQLVKLILYQLRRN